MKTVCLVLRAHAPYRLRRYTYFDVGRRHDYFDAETMRGRLGLLDRLCLEPAATMLGGLLEADPSFRCSLSLSGPLLEQLEAAAPQRLGAFRRLVETGRVEPLDTTSHRCLAWAISWDEVETQAEHQRDRIRRRLGREPAVFGGEDSSDPGELAWRLESLGLRGLLIHGADAPSASPDTPRFYRAPPPGRLPVMVLDAPTASDLSDLDRWISGISGDILCLSVDTTMVETPDGSMPRSMDGLEVWALRALAGNDVRFVTASEAFREFAPQESLPAAAGNPAPNELQRDARVCLAALEPRVGDAEASSAVDDFRRLTSSDHFDAMSLGARQPATSRNRGAESPYETYLSFRHAVSDLEGRLARRPTSRAASRGSGPA